LILTHGGAFEFELPSSQEPAPLAAVAPEAVTAETIIPEDERRRRERSGGLADLLGIHPATLASRIKALGIRAHEKRRHGARRTKPRTSSTCRTW